MQVSAETKWLEEEFKKVTQKWNWNAIIWDILMHAGALYAVYIMIAGGFSIPPHFSSTTYWALFAASLITVFIGIAILGIVFPRHYVKQKPLRYEGVFGGLLLFFAGFTASFVIFTMAVPAFSAWMWFVMYLICWLRILGITIGYHRLPTHRSFKCGKLFARSFLVMGALARQSKIDWWGPEHLIHHERTEIEAQDPHTPRESFIHAHIGWIWHPYIYPDSIMQLKRFTRGIKDDPLVQEQKKYCTPVMISGFVAPAFIFGIIGFFSSGLDITNALSEAWKSFLLVDLGFVITHNITMSVNSWSHTWGPQPYKNKKTGDSRDVWYLSVFSAGENLQNIHHLLDSVACYWIKPHYVDISGALIVASNWFNRFSCLKWVGFPYQLNTIDLRHLKVLEKCSVKNLQKSYAE